MIISFHFTSATSTYDHLISPQLSNFILMPSRPSRPRRSLKRKPKPRSRTPTRAKTKSRTKPRTKTRIRTPTRTRTRTKTKTRTRTKTKTKIKTRTRAKTKTKLRAKTKTKRAGRSTPVAMVVYAAPARTGSGCTEQFTKKYQSRPSPAYPAQECRGRIMSRYGVLWQSRPDINGVYTWKKL